MANSTTTDEIYQDIDLEDMSWARLLLADELEAKDAKIERLRARVDELESELVGALGAAGHRLAKEHQS